MSDFHTWSFRFIYKLKPIYSSKMVIEHSFQCISLISSYIITNKPLILSLFCKRGLSYFPIIFLPIHYDTGTLIKLSFKMLKLKRYMNFHIKRLYLNTYTLVFQLLEYKSFTYTYLLADPDTNEAILIDPVLETADRDVKLVTDLGLKLLYGGMLSYLTKI